MESKDSLATISRDTTSKQPDSRSTEAIRQFLVKAGEVYRQPITVALISIWIEELDGYPVEKLAGMFRHVLRTWKPEYGRTFPTPADVLAPLENSPALQTEADLKWQQVLDVIRVYWSPDLPGGFSRGAPRLTERTATAIRAAGGFAWIADCPRDALVWAKKAFCESYMAWETLQRDQYLLPDGSPVKALLSQVCRTVDPRSPEETAAIDRIIEAESRRVNTTTDDSRGAEL